MTQELRAAENQNDLTIVRRPNASAAWAINHDCGDLVAWVDDLGGRTTQVAVRLIQS